MSIRRFLFALATLALLSPAAAHAQSVVPPEATHAEFAYLWWKPEPDITIASGSLSSDIDLVNDLGISDTRFRELRIALKPGRKHKVRFSYTPIKYTADQVPLQRTVVFNGRTYAVSVPVSSDVKWDFYRFGYEWDAISMRRGFIGLVTEVKYNKITASLDSAIVSEQTEVTAPVPTIGGIARGYLTEYVSVTGEFTALKLDRTDFRAKFYDFDLYGQVNLTRNVAAQVGYRSIDADYRVDADNGVLKLKGVYFGGAVRF